SHRRRPMPSTVGRTSASTVLAAPPLFCCFAMQSLLTVAYHKKKADLGGPLSKNDHRTVRLYHTAAQNASPYGRKMRRKRHFAAFWGRQRTRLQLTAARYRIIISLNDIVIRGDPHAETGAGKFDGVDVLCADGADARRRLRGRDHRLCGAGVGRGGLPGPGHAVYPAGPL